MMFENENKEILKKLFKIFSVPKPTKKYLKSKVGLYWQPKDFIRWFYQHNYSRK